MNVEQLILPVGPGPVARPYHVQRRGGRTAEGQMDRQRDRQIDHTVYETERQTYRPTVYEAERQTEHTVYETDRQTVGQATV